jgi:BioD-like phosphotransacetylase family protein
MTTTMYVTSTQTFSGKSALCIGLLSRFKRDGFVVGYMKPVSTTSRIVGDQVMDEDADFVKSTFGMVDSLETMAPVVLTDQRVAAILAGEEENLDALVQSAYQTIAIDKDILVLEGGGSLREGWIVNLAPPHVADLLKACTLVLVPYDNDLQLVDDLITARVRMGDCLLGAVVNRVPAHRMDFVRNEVKPFVERRNVPVFAVLPRQRVLLSVSVSELAEKLGGEVLSSHDAVEELVENLMVGAMSVDSALTYFRRKPNKAVITGGDRPDIQLAALETSTRCLILTGNIRPSPLIVGRAEEAGVPIILTRHDTMSAVETIETFFGKTRFHQEKKVESFESLLNEHIDFEMIYASLGLR